MSAPTTFAVAIACGAAGAYVDVSSYLESTEDFTYSWGRQSSFDDVDPGEFSFVLNNADGRFTPDNSSSALAVTLTEGMGVCWQLNSRLVAGTIQAIEPLFPGDVAAWATVKITVDDMLGSASRRDVDNLSSALIAPSQPLLRWTLEDDEEAIMAAEANGGAPLIPSGNVLFGVDGIPGVSETQVRLFSTASSTAGLYSADIARNLFKYPTTTIGGFGFWASITGDSTTARIQARFQMKDAPLLQIWAASDSNGPSASLQGGLGSGATRISLDTSVPHYYSFVIATTYTGTQWDLNASLYVDGVLIGTGINFIHPATIADRTPTSVDITLVANSEATAYISHLTHSITPLNEYPAASTTEAGRIAAIVAAVPELALDTLPTLDSAPLGPSDEGSALSLLADVIRGEQGQIHTTTTGTLTAPVQKIKIRARDRPTAVSYTFGVESDLIGSPRIIRGITDLASSVDVEGPYVEVTVTDTTLIPRAGSKNDSAHVVFANKGSLLEWGSDRLMRGAITKPRVETIVIDARTTSTDRWANLLAMVPGDRVQVTGLPSTQLGFSSWDGWFLGATEIHNTNEDIFELYFEPCSPATAIYDTDRYMAGDDLTLSSAITAVATSISVATIGATFTTTGADLPLTITVDSEQMTVTACTSATPQVMTVTRGVNGTTAAVHAAGAQVELTTSTLYAY